MSLKSKAVHLKKYAHLASEFSPRISLSTGLTNAYPYSSHSNALGWKITQYHHNGILSWLNKHYGTFLDGSTPVESVIDRFERTPPPGAACVRKNRTIWTMWWQGQDDAPALVKACLSSIKSHHGDFDFVCLDQKNISQYVILPDHILSKRMKGQISLAHLSDIVRMYLLYHYGGLWLDATTYVIHDIESEILNNGFFTCRNIAQKNEFVSRAEWAGNAIGMECGSNIAGSILSCFYEYWDKHDTLVVYLLSDYLLALLFSHNTAAAALFQKIPINNIRRNELAASLNAPYDPSFFNERPDTTLYKLNWKRSYKERSDEGKETFYHYLLSHASR
ncbi:MAG: hypothetical protein IKH57_23070 [Clostridia bacterium]|nr:hypothetical protein [Clostridia bacterium]